MDVLEQLQELWGIIVALPGQVWLNALYLFVVLGLGKAVGVIRDDGFAAAVNGILAIFMTGGFAGITELADVLQTSGVAVVAAVYYHLWKNYVGPFVGNLVEKIKGAIPSKG